MALLALYGCACPGIYSEVSTRHVSSAGEQEEESGVVVHNALEVLVLTHCWSLGKCGFMPRYHPLRAQHVVASQ